MQQTTKSVSEFLRNIRGTIDFIKVDIDDMPDFDVAGELSISMFNNINKTGDAFSVSLDLNLEVQVSGSVKNCKRKAREITSALIEHIEGNCFGSTSTPPSKIAAIPLGDNDRFVTWLITWEQEVYVERFHTSED